MTSDKVKRKLAAILSADVQGYSRLMGEDEEGTIRTLKAYLEVISGSYQAASGTHRRHRGGQRPGRICQRGGCRSLRGGDPERTPGAE